MGLRAVLPGVGVLVAAIAALGQTARTEPEPRYDPGTAISELGTVIEIREVPRDSPLAGLHLLVKTDTETIESYVGPVSFLKELGLTISKSDQVHIAGSKVKFGSGHIVLLRELRQDNSTWYLRDQRGNPYWPVQEKRKT